MNNMNPENPTYEELKKAQKLDEFLADLALGRASSLPADMQHDAAFLKDIQMARDFSMVSKNVEPSPAFVKALEQKLVSRANENPKNHRQTKRRASFIYQFLPYSIGFAGVVVIVLAVVTLGSWQTTQTSPTAVRQANPADASKVSIAQNALKRTGDSIAENLQAVKEKLTSISPQPDVPPKSNEPSETPDSAPSREPLPEPLSEPVKMAALPSDLLSDLNTVDDDFVLAEADINDDTVFASSADLQTFFADTNDLEL